MTYISDKPTVLTGFMAAGKTYLGKKAAEFLNLNFIDMDVYLESKFRMSVSEMFHSHGEKWFREQEQFALREVLGSKPALISLGGGAFENEQLRDILLSEALVIFVDTKFDCIYQRVSETENRPLIGRLSKKPGGLRENLLRLYQMRLPNYEKAHARLKASQHLEHNLQALWHILSQHHFIK